jgi:hypothetical protein
MADTSRGHRIIVDSMKPPSTADIPLNSRQQGSATIARIGDQSFAEEHMSFDNVQSIRPRPNFAIFTEAPASTLSRLQRTLNWMD